MHRRSIEDAYASIWRVGNKEMGDDVDCLSFLILVLVCLLEGTHADRVGLDVYRWSGRWREELEGRDMIGDIVFSVLVFIVWGGVNQCVCPHVLLRLVEEGIFSSDCLGCWIVGLLPLWPPTSLKRTSFSTIVITQWSTSYRKSNYVLSLILFKNSREITVGRDNRG